MLIKNVLSVPKKANEMLSYQHIYHAGCAADVHKHASLSVLLNVMTQKDKPLTYFETHAGRGVYDLNAPEAEKTKEADKGIRAFLKSEKLPDSHPYISLLKKMTAEVGENVYPGSPFIAEALLRPTDTLILSELHPQEYRALKHIMSYPNVHIHNRDGYEAALALCPPTPRRGMVFIDPSYEIKSEYEKAAKTVLKLHKKWAEGVIAVWYPVLASGEYKALKDILLNAELPKLYANEVSFHLKKGQNGIEGSGLIVINTPYGAESELEKIKEQF